MGVVPATEKKAQRNAEWMNYEMCTLLIN